MNNEVNTNIKQKNTLAILGFIFSFINSIAGLILSIVGLKKSKELNNGKGLSIAGIIISSLSILITSVIVIICLYVIDNNIDNYDPASDAKDDVYHKLYCSKSYNCEKNIFGYYTCDYKESDGKVYSVYCKESEIKTTTTTTTMPTTKRQYSLQKGIFSTEPKDKSNGKYVISLDSNLKEFDVEDNEYNVYKYEFGNVFIYITYYKYYDSKYYIDAYLSLDELDYYDYLFATTLKEGETLEFNMVDDTLYYFDKEIYYPGSTPNLISLHIDKLEFINDLKEYSNGMPYHLQKAYFENDKLIIVGDRVLYDEDVDGYVVNSSNGESSSLCSNENLINEVIEQTYEFKIENNEIKWTPTITNKIYYKDYLKSHSSYCE